MVLEWNKTQGYFAKGYTFPTPGAFALNNSHGTAGKLMLAYGIKSSEWKSFSWELRLSLSLSLSHLFHLQFYRITMTKIGSNTHMGFISGPSSKHANFGSTSNYVYSMGKDGWGVPGVYKGSTSLLGYYNGNSKSKSVGCDSLKSGDSFIWTVDFDKKEIWIGVNGKEKGIIFTGSADVPDEIIPALSEPGTGHEGSIRFVEGVKR